MKIRHTVTEVEGEPEEVLKVRQLFGGMPEQVSAVPEHSEAALDAVSTNGASATPELVLRVLTRRELSDDIKKVLKVLTKAGSKGLTSEELAKAVGIDRGQLAGVHGAFGRRIANTKGWPAGARIIEKYRDENGRRRHHLTDVVRTALEKFDL